MGERANRGTANPRTGIDGSGHLVILGGRMWDHPRPTGTIFLLNQYYMGNPVGRLVNAHGIRRATFDVDEGVANSVFPPEFRRPPRAVGIPG